MSFVYLKKICIYITYSVYIKNAYCISWPVRFDLLVDDVDKHIYQPIGVLWAGLSMKQRKIQIEDGGRP